MAFETLYEFSDKIAEQHAKAKNQNNYTKVNAFFDSLVLYYETVLSNPKFRSQRQHCKVVMMSLNPAFCEGYFKTKKDGKKALHQNTTGT
mgnify:CR=1 FL=1